MTPLSTGVSQSITEERMHARRLASHVRLFASSAEYSLTQVRVTLDVSYRRWSVEHDIYLLYGNVYDRAGEVTVWGMGCDDA